MQMTRILDRKEQCRRQARDAVLTKLKIVVGELSPADSPAEGQCRVGIQVADQSCSPQALLCLGQRFGDRDFL